ncbi:MAG: hypothetical protein QF691_09050, partial [SAR324 cluster bacterium]|nr:hypothetical protein [SAR324 cluster bacterium]
CGWNNRRSNESWICSISSVKCMADPAKSQLKVTNSNTQPNKRIQTDRYHAARKLALFKRRLMLNVRSEKKSFYSQSCGKIQTES